MNPSFFSLLIFFLPLVSLVANDPTHPEIDLGEFNKTYGLLKNVEDSLSGFSFEMLDQILTKEKGLDSKKKEFLLKRIKALKTFDELESELEETRGKLKETIGVQGEIIKTIENQLREKEQQLETCRRFLADCLSPPSSPPVRLSPLPLVNWLNVSLLNLFFDPLFHSLANREENFCSINSLNRFYLTLRPYALYSEAQFDHSSLNLGTAGLNLSGGLMLEERWVLGAEAGYWYSMFDWRKSKTTINSVYLGPSLTCFLGKAYVGLLLLGIYNFYDFQEIDLQKIYSTPNGWNLDAQLKGGIDIDLPAHSFIQPNLNLNYLVVFQNEEGEETLDSAILSRATFFRSQLAVQWRKEVQLSNKFLVPQASLGWVWMQPVSQTYEGSSSKKKQELSYGNANQIYVELGITGVHKRGILMTFDLEAFLDRTYPAGKASFKVEWNW